MNKYEQFLKTAETKISEQGFRDSDFKFILTLVKLAYVTGQDNTYSEVNRKFAFLKDFSEEQKRAD